MADEIPVTTQELLEAAQGLDDEQEGDALLVICHGLPRCTVTADADGEFEPCPWCYRVDADDPRSTEQILEDMQRGQ